MGCDIHFIIEQKVNDKWVGVLSTDALVYRNRPLGSVRNYEFFTKLASVRKEDNNKEVTPQPKGVPDDISDLSKMVIKSLEGDGHSHSWATAKEFCDAFTSSYLDKEEEFSPEKVLGIYTEEDGDIHPSLDNLRVVFFFDN